MANAQNNHDITLLKRMEADCEILLAYMRRNSSNELDRMLSQLSDEEFVKWCKEIVELIEDSRSYKYHALATIKAIVDRRVQASPEGILSQALNASWYQDQLVPASRKRDDAARIIQRHRTICSNNWGPLWSTVIDEGEL
jgi:hypothetical protein